MDNQHPTNERSGGCLCGAVRYQLTGKLRPVILCHCKQCQRSTGSLMAATAVRTRNFRLVADGGLHWYRSSDHGQRGFCGRCGSTLFWQGRDDTYLAIAAGTLDDDHGLTTVAHIFVADKGQYYQIHDTLPQYESSGHGIAVPE